MAKNKYTHRSYINEVCNLSSGKKGALGRWLGTSQHPNDAVIACLFVALNPFFTF